MRRFRHQNHHHHQQQQRRPLSCESLTAAVGDFNPVLEDSRRALDSLMAMQPNNQIVMPPPAVIRT